MNIVLCIKWRVRPLYVLILYALVYPQLLQYFYHLAAGQQKFWGDSVEENTMVSIHEKAFAKY